MKEEREEDESLGRSNGMRYKKERERRNSRKRKRADWIILDEQNSVLV